MSSPRALADALWAVRFRWNNRFRRRLTVLKCEPNRAPGDAAADGGRVAVTAYGPGESPPPALLGALADRFGADFPTIHEAERAGGATLWVGSLDKTATGAEPGPADYEPVGFARTRPGDRVRDWHEPLCPEDRLVYAMATHRPARGNGVSTAVLRAALRGVPADGAAWADTMIWNAPALAVLRRVGFVDLYEADPLPDHPD